jgi:hypothetical protein
MKKNEEGKKKTYNGFVIYSSLVTFKRTRTNNVRGSIDFYSINRASLFSRRLVHFIRIQTDGGIYIYTSRFFFASINYSFNVYTYNK